MKESEANQWNVGALYSGCHVMVENSCVCRSLAFGALGKLSFVGEGRDFLHGSGEGARHRESRPLLLVAPGGSCPEVGLW